MNIRPRPWLFLALVAAACSTSRHVERPAEDVVVHTFNRDYTNAHVLVSGQHAFMVDAGLESNAPALARDLQRAGIDPKGLDAIVLSHGHADHAGGAGWFQRTYGTPIVVGAADEKLLRAGHNDRLCPTDATAERRHDSDQSATYTPARPDVVVAGELDLFEVTGIPAVAVSLPGHTEGSLVVVLDEVVLVGDLFRGSILGRSATTHFYMCDLDDNHDDVRRVLDEIAPDGELFFTGHFGPVKRAAVEAEFDATAREPAG